MSGQLRPATLGALFIAALLCAMSAFGCAPGRPTGAGNEPTAAPARPTAALTSTPTKGTVVPTAAPPAETSGEVMPPYPGATRGTVTDKDREQMQQLQAQSPLKNAELRVYGTDDKPAAVVTFYQNEMKKRGWQVAITMTNDQGGLIQWKKDNLQASMLTSVREGKTIILLGWGERAPVATPTPRAHTLKEALALAQARAREWQADAYVTHIEGGGAFGVPLLSPEGRGAFWHVRFYSPGTKMERYVNVDGRSGKDEATFAGSAAAAASETTPLEAIMDSTEACAKAAALGGQEVTARYSDAQVFLSAYADKTRIHFFVQYYSKTAEKAGIPLGYVLGLELDGKTGALVGYQQNDGKPVTK